MLTETGENTMTFEWLLWYYMLAILKVYKLRGQLMTAFQSSGVFWGALACALCC